MFKVQRQMNEADMPSAALKLDILQMVIQRLLDEGYVYIGMDHFAKPDDELAIAQREGRLYRNFQGYSTHSECDMVGFGITSIGRVGDAYIQNVKQLDQYAESIEKDNLPVFKGMLLNADDKLRGAIISQLMCHFELDYQRIEQEYSIVFAEYFTDALQQLEIMQQDGLLTMSEQGIVVKPGGRLLIRNICMVFDQYSAKKKASFSKVI